jgi:hemolysin activation/secretion protein
VRSDPAPVAVPALPRSPGVGRRWLGRALIVAAALACMAPASAQTENPAGPTFAIERFAVDGNTALAKERIDEALAPYTGAGRSFADVQAAVGALQAAYARAGFGAVRVLLPEQEVTSGIVRLGVRESRVRIVTIDGNVHFDTDNVRRSLPSLRVGATPNTDALAGEIRLANENPAKRVTVDLRSEPAGAIDALVSVHDEKAWKVGAVVDNTGTPSTGLGRAGVFYQHANVAGRDQVATLQYITSTTRPKDVTIAAFNDRIPLPTLGDSIDVFGVYSNVDSGVVSNLFTVRGSGTVVGVRYSQNLRPSADFQHRFLYGLENRKIINRVGVEGGSPDLVPDVTVRPASVGYAASWSGPVRQLELSGTLVRNIPGGTNGHSADIEAARAGASAYYTILRVGASVLQGLPRECLLRVAVDGQYTQDALVSGEQFGVGGQDSVRGFAEREVVNDRGTRATVELQSADFGEQVSPGLAFRALAFFDQGWVYRNHPLPGELANAHAATAGVGVRVSMAPAWNLRADAAHVTHGAGATPRGTERVHFSLGFVY